MQAMGTPPAVVGHVEWVQFCYADRLPAPGQGVEVTPIMELAAGGGTNVAVELADLAGGALLFTALGDDELGHRAAADLERHGVDAHVAWREQPTQRTLALMGVDGEKSELFFGPPLEPSGADPLPWHLLAASSAVYF